MHSVSGVDLIRAKLQSTLLQDQKRFVASNPGSASKNLQRKERKRLNKLRRQFPLYKTLSNESVADSSSPSGGVPDFVDNNLFGSTNSWNPAQIQIDFEEVDESNIFIEQVKAKFECLNPSYNLCGTVKSSSTENLLGILPIGESKNEDVDSGVDSLGGSSSSSASLPSSARPQPSLSPTKLTKAEKKRKKNLELEQTQNKNKLQNLLVRRLNSINSEETEQLLPSLTSPKLSPQKATPTKFKKMTGSSAETEIDTTPTSNQVQSPQQTLSSDSKTSATPTSPRIISNGISISQSQTTPAKNSNNLSPARPQSKSNQNNLNSPNGKIPQLPQPKVMIYNRDKVQPGWRQRMPVGCGFTNMGNSCYMNATLQALFHVPSFANWLIGDQTHRAKCRGQSGTQFTSGQCIVCAMYNTISDSIKQHVGQSIRPSWIHNRLKSICKHFSQGRQEDAHEFLRYLLESMERSYLITLGALKLDVRSKETTPIGQIFGGYIRTEVTCLRCNTVSTTFQPLAELQLDIRHSTTLDDATSNHFKRERLDNNDYKCEKCRGFSAATKQFSLEVPPIALCLQLKRFSYIGMKISKPIHCNKTLNLTRFLHKSLKNGNQKDVKYRLTSLITHIGSSPNCGHYTAIAQASNGTFYQFDDSFVHSVPVEAATNSHAYVIIYELDTGNYEKPSSCFNANYTNGNSNSPLNFVKANNLNTPNNLSKLLTSNSELKNGNLSTPLTNGNSNGVRPKFQNPFLKSTEKSATSNVFDRLSHVSTTGPPKATTPTTNGHVNGVPSSLATLEKREKVSFSLNSSTPVGSKTNFGGNKILLKNTDAHIPTASSYLTPSARARQSSLPDNALAALNALAGKSNGKLCNGTNGVNSAESKKEDNTPSLLKAELLSSGKKPPLEVSANSKTLPKDLKSSASLVPYDGDDDEDTSEGELEKDESKSKSRTNSPPPAENQEESQDRSFAQSPLPAQKLFPIFNKSTVVKSWDGQKSVISQVEEANRKREKTREELEDDEFDAGHVKKRKKDEFSKSRSSSASSRDGDSQYGNNNNKFQSYEDRRRQVEKTLIPSSSSSSSFGSQNRQNGNGLSNGFSSNNSSGFQDGERRNHWNKNDREREPSNERRDSSSSNNSSSFVKYASSFPRGNSSYDSRYRGGQGNFRGYRNDSFRRGGGGYNNNNSYNRNRYNNNNGGGGGYYRGRW